MSRYCKQSVTLWSCCTLFKPSVKVLFIVCHTLVMLHFFKSWGKVQYIVCHTLVLLYSLEA